MNFIMSGHKHLTIPIYLSLSIFQHEFPFSTTKIKHNYVIIGHMDFQMLLEACKTTDLLFIGFMW